MLVIGIAGGVGSGKSSVTSELATLGAKVLDVDRIGHDLLNETEIFTLDNLKFMDIDLGQHLN